MNDWTIDKPFYLDKHLWGVLFFALICQLVFYTGVFGSDEVTYNEAALHFLKGENSGSTYIGALRYGVNIPVAFFFSIFGVNEFAANIWSFSCSLGEVVIVFLFTKLFFDRKTALIAALLLATLPVHLHYSGRMMADIPLGFFISLSFYFFAVGEKENSAKYFLYSGLSFGFTYWLKASVTALLSPIFIIYALVCWKFNINWLWFLLGGVILFVSNLLLMWLLFENPFHHLNVIFNSLESVSQRVNETSKLFYLNKLFIDIRYTWVLGLASLFATIMLWKSADLKNNKIILIWCLWGIFSLSVISLRQSNYMLVVCFPLVILAAVYFAKFRFYLFLVLWIPAALILTGLKQQDTRNYNSNSQALSQYIQNTKLTLFIASQRAINVHFTNQLLQGNSEQKMRSFTLEDFDAESLNAHKIILSIDQETLTLDDSKRLMQYLDVKRECFTPLESLTPIGFGVGQVVLQGIRTAIEIATPNSVSNKILPRLKSYSLPKPMFLYEASISCIKSKNS